MSNDPQDQAKNDLIYAILAMDLYNRGYGVGISGLGISSDTKSFKIDDWVADAKDATSVLAGAEFDACFYALTYPQGDKNVVANRGTDKNGRSIVPAQGGSDALNGYGIALGAA